MPCFPSPRILACTLTIKEFVRHPGLVQADRAAKQQRRALEELVAVHAGIEPGRFVNNSQMVLRGFSNIDLIFKLDMLIRSLAMKIRILNGF